MNKDKSKIIFIILIFAILFGIFFRVYDLNHPFIPIDDQVFVVGTLKMHHQSFQDGVKYVWNHPPLGKYMAGIFTIGMYDESFEVLKHIPPQMFGYAHLAYQPLKKTIYRIHLSYLFFGILSIMLIYIITKKIYSEEAALWAAALFSLSLDFISFSRAFYPEQFMVFLTLATLYFYMEFVYFSKKKIHLLFFTISLLFLVNSRQFQPVLIAMTFLAHYLLKKYVEIRDIQKAIDAVMNFIFSYIVVAILTFFLYRPLPPAEFTHSGLLVFGFQLHKIIEVLIFRNSYISLLALVFLTYFSYKNIHYVKILIKDPKILFGYKMIIPYLFIASILSMMFFNFPYTSLSRYLCVILAFAIILEGVAIEKVMRLNKKALYIIVTIFLVLSLFQIFNASRESPPFISNSNFEIDRLSLLPNIFGTGYSHTIYEELEKIGNPSVITNLAWLATYYEGNIIMPPLPNANSCNQEHFDVLRDSGAILVVMSPNFFSSEPWASCEEFRSLDFIKIKSLSLKDQYGEKMKEELSFYEIRQVAI